MAETIWSVVCAMQVLEAGRRFLKIYSGEESLHDLDSILHPRLHFKGPLLEVHSAAEYIDYLKQDPPDQCEYKELQVFEEGNRACIIYEFFKPGTNSTIAQYFEMESNMIIRTILIFDRADFT